MVLWLGFWDRAGKMPSRGGAVREVDCVSAGKAAPFERPKR
jgi:hypothetical protein